MGHLLNMGIKMSGSSEPVTVYWGFETFTTCASRSFTISKNGVVQVNRIGSTARQRVIGDFTAKMGDSISISNTSGTSGLVCEDAYTEAFLITDGEISKYLGTSIVYGLNQTASVNFVLNQTNLGDKREVYINASDVIIS